jgi:hypothetical protein
MTDTAFLARRQTQIEKADGQLRELGEALEDAERRWQQVEFSFQPMVICAECGGRGTSSNGIFGETECWICLGGRQVPHPDPAGARAALAPDFHAARKMLHDARQAVIAHERWLTAAERATYKGLPLPDEPAADMPGASDLSAITHEIRIAARRIEDAMKPPRAPGEVLPGEPHLELDAGDSSDEDA